jgi:hypothetical protein
MKRRQYRQGDVLIERVDSVPTGAQKQVRSRRIVLAEGEATGHSHTLEFGTIDDDPADWWKVGTDEKIVRVGPGARVSHQEHATIPLPPGIYRVRRQREYTPQEVRNVAD